MGELLLLSHPRYPVYGIFDVSHIFDARVPAFDTQEICQPHSVPSGARLFQLSSHTHRHGKRFQTFRGLWTCNGGSDAGRSCNPLSSESCTGGSCTEATGRSAASSLLYSNYVYNDPPDRNIEPPLVFTGSEQERALTFCSLFDNGATDPQEVKRRSTSPRPPNPLIPIGGPCRAAQTRCIGGPRHNQLCNGNPGFCDSSPGAGDGDCDACPLTGGFTTEDEMFVLIGGYYIP